MIGVEPRSSRVRRIVLPISSGYTPASDSMHTVIPKANMHQIYIILYDSHNTYQQGSKLHNIFLPPLNYFSYFIKMFCCPYDKAITLAYLQQKVTH